MRSTAAPRRVTAADIAREVGVSRATVGFVLNETPGQTISETTRQRVLAAAERLGYRPHLAAQALARGGNRIVLLVLPDWPLEYSMRRHIDVASHALGEAGYSLVTMTEDPASTARPLWESLQPDVVMGMVPFSAEQVERIRASGVPTVIPGASESSAEPDPSYSGGPRLQVEHLIDRGHRSIAFADTPDPRLAVLATARLSLARACAEAAGLTLADDAVDKESAAATVARWHRSGVTGVAAYNDDIAALVVGAAIRSGLRVPQDLAVIGHDDSPLAGVFLPALSSVHIDDSGIGKYFAELALNAVSGDSRAIKSPVAEATLVQRESS